MSRVGKQEPTFHYADKYKKTEGCFASSLSASYDLKPHPWQNTILDDWLAVDNKGKLIHSFCVLEVPRQNGKTGVSDPRETWGLIKRGESILHTAQEFQTAKKAFDRLRRKFGMKKNDPFAEYPELNALVDHYTTSAGQMVLDLTNGAHIEFRTRGSSSDMGRGGTFDLVVIDEAQAYTEAQDAALSPLNSAAPTGSPQTILMGTPPLLVGGDKGLIFSKAIENFKKNPQSGACLHQWSAKEIGNPNDKNRWYEYNPSLGYQLLESALEKDALTMSPDSFAREHLGFMPLQSEIDNRCISEALWDSCSSEELKPEGKTAYGVKFSADGATVALCGAVISDDGMERISLIDCRGTARGVQWLADWLNERSKKASCVVIDGRNGVDVLIDKIKDTWKIKNSIVRPTTKEVIAAASLVINELSEKRLTWYEKQQILRESAITAVKRPISGGWGFGGDNSTPVEAAALALYGAKTSKRNPNKSMKFG